MSRLVDVDELKHELKWLEEYDQPVYHDVVSTIDEIATVDAEPVKHGHWIVDEDGNIKCSECGHRGVGDNYCERCGAKMEVTE